MNKRILQKYIEGETSPAETEKVLGWIEADDEHRKEYRDLRRMHDLTIWQDEGEFERYGAGMSFWRRFLPFGGVAAVLICVCTALYVFQTRNHEPSAVAAAEVKSIYVPAGQRAELLLADSTVVWLNSRTTLTFPDGFNEKTRSVTLDGEGYFKVKTDKDRPFIVKTKHYNIKVLGTEFNLKAYSIDDKFETSLLKGSVLVENKEEKPLIRMRPGTTVCADDGVVHESRLNQTDYFRWKDGVMCFENITLEELFHRLNLYYDVDIIVRNREILQEKYTGKFRVGDGVEHILKTLQLRTRFQFERQDPASNTILIQ
jgi:Fe2+-dicitrate sensor, membrane component